MAGAMGDRSTLRQAGEALRRRFRGHPRVAVQKDVNLLMLGSDYGGYAVSPEGLDEGSVVYSFGIGEDASFDVELMQRFGVTIHAFDPTPRSIAWVESQQLGPRFVMHPWGLASYDGSASFTPPENPEHVSHTVLDRSKYSGDKIEVPVYRLATILEKLGHDRLDILKMDIEGAEYEVIDDLVASTLRPRQVLLEYHHHLEGVPLERSEASIRALCDAGYAVVHIADSGRELSFVLRD
jgi:FkbM family methyltransferase